MTSGDSGFSLDTRFWRKFIASYWKRKPTVIHAPFRRAIATAEEIFRASVRARRRLREPTEAMSLYLGGRQIRVLKDLQRLLPRRSDASLENYRSRLKEAAEQADLLIHIAFFQFELGRNFFDRVRQFLKTLYEIEGVPADAGVDFFFGDYRQTPSGMHLDTADIFYFVLEGKKRMRLWPPKRIQSACPRLGPSPYTEYLEGSICLEGGPVDILYWPASY